MRLRQKISGSFRTARRAGDFAAFANCSNLSPPMELGPPADFDMKSLQPSADFSPVL